MGKRQLYTITGKPLLPRSKSEKAKFLRQRGFTFVPRGYQIDHIVPLWLGGKDLIINMQLLPIEKHKLKTKKELRIRNMLRFAALKK